MSEDILQEISNDQLSHLSELYKIQSPRLVYAHNFLNNIAKWKSLQTNEISITVMSPNGKWKNGTFLAITQYYSWYEIFISTLETNPEILYDVITNTKKVDWNKRIMMYAVQDQHYSVVLKALDKIEFSPILKLVCDVWSLPVKQAATLQITCTREIYIAKLKKCHAKIVNHYWTHKHTGSVKFVEFIIETNGGYGAFLRSNDQLVAWILKNQIGLGMLHVLKEYTRKGYGTLVTRALSKEMAKDGVHPLAASLTDNVAAQVMLKNIGFETSEGIAYLHNYDERNGYSDD